MLPKLAPFAGTSNTSNIRGHNIGPMKFLRNWLPNERYGICINKAIDTAYVAPRRPKIKIVTYGPTDRRTDGPTHALMESL